MKKNVFICIFLTLSFFAPVLAQTSLSSNQISLLQDIQETGDSREQVHIFQDSRIDSLIAHYIGQNYKKQTIPGFRIRIFLANNQDNGRQRAYETKARFITAYPDIEAYVIYETPDWKVLVGDFRSRSDAFRFKKLIDPMFPNNRLIDSQIDCTKN